MKDGVRKMYATVYRWMYVGHTDYVTQQPFQAYNQMNSKWFWVKFYEKSLNEHAVTFFLS